MAALREWWANPVRHPWRVFGVCATVGYGAIGYVAVLDLWWFHRNTEPGDMNFRGLQTFILLLVWTMSVGAAATAVAAACRVGSRWWSAATVTRTCSWLLVAATTIAVLLTVGFYTFLAFTQ